MERVGRGSQAANNQPSVNDALNRSSKIALFHASGAPSDGQVSRGAVLHRGRLD
jgi:hypothetical protein